MIFKGYCKECGNEVYEKDRIPTYKDVYECSKCGHPHSKDELWDELPSYLEKEETIYIIPTPNDKPLKIVIDDDRYEIKQKGELEFEIIDHNPDIEEVFQNLNINIKNEDGTYKYFADVLEELTEAWDGL